jgi:hypothetical protein
VLVKSTAPLPADRGPVRRRGRRTAGLRLGTPLAFAFAIALALPSGDAAAAGMRGSAAPIAAMLFLTALLAVREWPVELVGSAWAVGTLFAAAVCLVGSKYRPVFFWLASKSLVRRTAFARFNPAPVVSQDLVPPREKALIAAKQCFLALQAAWDVGDVEALRARTTPQMLDDLLQELPMRGAGPNRTDVVTLDALLLAFERIGHRYVASVEFSGMIRESAERGAAPFKEVWMLTCAEDDMRDWRLARQQALL